MFYGNPSCIDQSYPEKTWDSNRYLGVWHANDFTASTIKDSTGIKDGTKRSSNHPLQVPGKIGYAQSFSGVDGVDDIKIFDTGGSPTRNYGTNPFTYEVWFKPGDVTRIQEIYTTEHNIWSGGRETGFVIVNSNVYLACRDSSGVAKQVYTPVSNGNWYFVTGVRQNDFTVVGYCNGDYFTSNNISGANANYQSSNREWIGSDLGLSSGQSFNGIIDEVRLETVNTTFAWHKTEYNNQNDPAGFLSIGPEEPGP
jgi:hypothetical protein